MKNKILAFSIILSMLFAMTVVPAHAASSGTCGADLTWTLNSGKLTISGTGAMTNWSSSSSVPWYSSSSSIKTVVIQNGVTSIGSSAFYGCSTLTSITIPDIVTSIGRSAFSGCSSLTAITIPDSVTSIGDYAFYGCSSLTSITIPDGVTSIGYSAFDWCSSLTSITIPDSVTGTFCIRYCSSLTSITIPDSVTIGYEPFLCCTRLTSINVSENNQKYSSQDGVLFNKDKTCLLCCPGGKQGIYTIPDSVTRIEAYAFEVCVNLTAVIIPDSVTSIGGMAFCDCRFTDIYYGGDESDWRKISAGHENWLQSVTISYNCKSVNKLTAPHNNNGETVTLPEGNVLDTGKLNFRNGYVYATNGYVKAGDRKITGSNIYFNNEGKIRLQDGDTAKIERDNDNGTTDQGFMAGVFNPTGIIRMVLEVTGTANEVDYTGRTRTEEFDFTNSEIAGLANFGVTIRSIPKPLSLQIKSIE